MFGISEQIPKDGQDRCKALLPAFKDAKRQGKRARFVGDKLLVEVHFITPNTSQHAYDMPGEHSYMHDYVC